MLIGVKPVINGSTDRLPFYLLLLLSCCFFLFLFACGNLSVYYMYCSLRSYLVFTLHIIFAFSFRCIRFNGQGIFALL